MTAVHELMSTSPVTVVPDTTLTELLSLFDRYGYNAFPVLGDAGRLVGIVSQLDLLRPFVVRRPRRSSGDEGSARVIHIMQKKVVTVRSQDSIVDVGKLMLVTKLRSLPVIHRRRRNARAELVGMVSRGDLLRGFGYRLDLGARRQTARP
jgi:CBS domain-containing protein